MVWPSPWRARNTTSLPCSLPTVSAAEGSPYGVTTATCRECGTVYIDYSGQTNRDAAAECCTGIDLHEECTARYCAVDLRANATDCPYFTGGR